jgi:hypothetical protein
MAAQPIIVGGYEVSEQSEDMIKRLLQLLWSASS